MATRREDDAGAAVRQHRRQHVAARACSPTCSAPARSAMRSRSGSIPTFDRRHDLRHARDHEAAAAPIHIPKRDAPVNEIVLRGDDIDLTALPGPEILARRRRPLHRHRRHHLHARSRHRPHQCRRATGRCCTGRTASGFIARPASTAGSTATPGGQRGKPCEVVAAYGIDPVLFMLGGAGLRRRGIRARRRRRHHGPADRADRGRVSSACRSRRMRSS